MRKKRLALINALCLLFCLSIQTTYAVVFTKSGISGKGVPISFEADMTITGDFLTIILKNTSPVNSLNPDDALSSFYFDILDENDNRPTLTYLSAVGDIYTGNKSNPDVLQAANGNIKAVNAGDNSWMFKVMIDTQKPFLGFGIGTAGNANLAPNNFQGSIVDGINYSIYRNEVTTTNLDGLLLEKNTATFTFTGLTGFVASDIVPRVVFGLGTAPDSTMTVPEPATIGLLVLIALAFFRKRRS